MTATMTATKAVMKSRNWLALDHYLLAPYASTEQHYQRMVVVDPSIAEPTWLLRPGTRKVVRRNIMALIVPSLADLTYDLAVEHTHVVTDYQGLRELPAAERRRGNLYAHTLPLIAEKITADGPILLTRPTGSSVAA